MSDTHPVPDYDELWSKLTAKQQMFVEGIIAGKTQIRAYKDAYNVAPTTPDTTTQVAASRLQANSKVALCIEMSRTKGVEFTRRVHDTALTRIALKAEQEGKYGAAITALQTMGKAAGLYVEQIKDVTEKDPLETITEIAQTNPEFAGALAKQFNIPFIPEHTTNQTGHA